MTTTATIEHTSTDTERDHEAEWKAAEAASLVVMKLGAPAWRDWMSEYADHQPSFTDRPHPDSYGADLPMRTRLSARGFPVIAALTPAEKKYLASRAAAPAQSRSGAVRPNSPHPDSYGADLPLRGGGMRREGGPKYKWALSAAEKALLATRPLKFSRSNGGN